MLLPFFEWCESLWLGRAVVGSLWLFPVIEAVHLLALSVLGGAVLLVDLRLLGVGLKHRTPQQLWREARPWMIGALAVVRARERGAEDRHQAVADHLVDDPALTADGVEHERVVAVQELDGLGR